MKHRVQENLVALYLRLNGYLTTSLIIHSEKDENVSGEIDIIGVRFPNHKQVDREIDFSPELDIPENKIDVIICEVKGGKSKLSFNKFLKNDMQNIHKLIEWIGVVDSENIEFIVEEFKKTIRTEENQILKPFPRIELDNYCIRPIMFAPDRIKPKANQNNFISGNTMINFCWDCFRPSIVRESCSTNYKSVSNWGEQFERIVGYFKDYDKTSAGTIEDLYNHFNV